MDSSPELSEMAEYMDFSEQRDEEQESSDKKQLKPHAQAHLLSATEFCKICGERAARHVHYGATTCFSCRAFFRRSLQNKTAAKYVCRRRSMCEINSKTRKNCQYCRYMKCLAVGMNPNYVLSEDERKKRFRKKHLSGNEDDLSQQPENQNTGLGNERMEANFQPGADQNNEEMLSDTKSEIAEQLLQLRDNFSAPVPVIASPPAMVSSSVPCNQTRSSIIVKNETMTSSYDSNSWFGINQNPVVVKPEPVKVEDFSAVDEIRSVLGADLDYHAFDAIDTAEFEESSEDTDLEEIRGRLLSPDDADVSTSDVERAEITKIISDHDNVYYSVNFGEVLIKEMLMCSMFGFKVSTSAALQGYKLEVERITRLANSLQKFTSLTKNDQSSLLKENADLIVSLRGALFFDKRKKGRDQVMSSMGHKDREMIDSVFSDMMSSNSMNHIEYNGFNTVQDPANRTTEDHYTQLQAKVAEIVSSHVIAVLMTYIILFSSDFVKLEQQKLVEKTQFYYLKLLERHIQDVEGKEHHSLLAKVLNAVTVLREMADIKKSRTVNSTACSQYQNNNNNSV